MYRLLYNCLIYLAMPLVLLRLAKRSIREDGYRRFISERFGWFRSQQPGEIIWIHSVSAGETIAAAPFVEHLVEAGFPCLVTNMTPTGRERVSTLLGDGVENCYAPYDLPGAVRRFLDRNRPRLLVTIDTELWPNILAGCASRNIPTALINGRMAARSAEGYARFPLTGPMLGSMSLIAVQTEAHARRFRELGADREKVQVTGSIKFDGDYAAGHDSRLAKARELLADRPVLLGASTHAGEETALLECLPQLEESIPDVLLVLAPRHTHRSGEVQRQCQSAGYQACCFSTGSRLEASDRVLILDVMGELESYLSMARVAFVGGSLVPVGGHNLLEAVRAGTAVVMGPHLDNVEDITDQFIERAAMRRVADNEELSHAVDELMHDEKSRLAMVNAASLVLDDNRGSIQRNIALVMGILDPAR